MTTNVTQVPEGVSYNPDNNSLSWVDIIEGKIHRAFLDNPDKVEEYKVSASVGVVGFTEDPDIYVCGVEDGIGQYNLKTRQFKHMAKYPEKEHFKKAVPMRSNEGAIDSEGNFWIGTFCDFVKELPNQATFYKFPKDDWEHPKIIKDHVTCPNGLNWHDDIMYWTDTEKGIYKYKFYKSTGLPDLSTETLFLPVSKIRSQIGIMGELGPDGSCIDASGNLYVALWGGASVIKVNPDGDIVHRWTFPAQRVSCVTLGGPDLNEMFVTTADLNLDNPDKLRSVPLDEGGKLFHIKLTGVKGVPKNKFKGKLIV
ncbi:hypothetical protein KL911_005125 [Ogataea haglerorum]|uniref:uncharacterized protein n=1 Tax=Ogataea haglerorum TaxID=1937702 RepID=UPI001C899788|nr:uncharacterized protein KL911_005125 [Ogataea haglerorum]KAG7749219.1 hypothetical protein KL911_005125 [Ogataea haglerorum]